jgi:hypothetical protein
LFLLRSGSVWFLSVAPVATPRGSTPTRPRGSHCARKPCSADRHAANRIDSPFPHVADNWTTDMPPGRRSSAHEPGSTRRNGNRPTDTRLCRSDWNGSGLPKVSPFVSEIGFLRKHHLLIVPSLHDVMRIVRKHYSSKSRHRSTPTPSVSTETAVSPKTPSRENRSVPVFTFPVFTCPRFYLVPVFPSPFLGRRWLGIQNACPMLT